mgnify:CR=1 FL=1
MIFGDLLEKNKKVLLIGGGGTLGSSIIKSNTFKNIDFPTRSQLDLLDRQSIRRFLKKKYKTKINLITVHNSKAKFILKGENLVSKIIYGDFNRQNILQKVVALKNEINKFNSSCGAT